jgi:hypothetical protein
VRSRRQFICQSTAATALLPLAACARADAMDYQAAAAKLRTDLSKNPDMQEILRFATLAANVYNTQPWRFSINGSNASIIPDLSRRTPEVDPDDHHLFISLGCAAENLLLAGAAHGRPGELLFLNTDGGRIDISLGRGKAKKSALYSAIPKRQTTRSIYQGGRISVEDLADLEAAANVEGVSIHIITDDRQREAVVDQVISANSQQMRDADFVKEMKQWVRFNPDEALAKRDGLFSLSTGTPIAPTFIGRALFSQFLDVDAENRKYATQIRSSPAIAVFTGDKANKDNWIKVGRSFQRFALQATALGLRHAHINQPIEVTSARQQFASWLGTPGSRPDLVIRLGYAPALPMSLRRPVTDVLVPWEISR